MWWVLISLGFVAFAAMLWCLCAGKLKEDDYEDQMKAIAKWKEKKEKKGK